MQNLTRRAAFCAVTLGSLSLAFAASKDIDSKHFVTKAAESNLAEIKVSQLALEKTQNSQVREFANQMIKDHEAANSQLEPIAQAKNLKVPQDTDAMHKAAMKMLQSKSGADFDSAYIKQMDKDHKKTIELFQQASSSSKLDPELQALAKKLLPTLQHHEQRVAQLENSTNSRNANADRSSGSTNR